jgi:hypothetical protein
MKHNSQNNIISKYEIEKKKLNKKGLVMVKLKKKKLNKKD